MHLSPALGLAAAANLRRQRETMMTGPQRWEQMGGSLLWGVPFSMVSRETERKPPFVRVFCVFFKTAWF